MYEFYLYTYLEIGTEVELIHYHKRTCRVIVVTLRLYFMVSCAKAHISTCYDAFSKGEPCTRD
jgi:hypothetical protein